jgi:4-amino-4-deoxy-L-arabinose transferase-like glycosyltransferase
MTGSREAWLVGALAVLPLLPFLGAAVSIDAPVFVAVAEQIAAHPLDPFGFEMVWDPTSPRVSEFDHNPPLLSYWLAPVVAAAGPREWALHLAVLPFPLLAALSFLGIARRLAGAGAAPVALLVSTPAFLLLASTLMLDVPVLALILASVYALLRANEGGGGRWECAAGLAAGAAALTKYVGMSALPLLAAGLVLLPAHTPATPARWLRVVGIPAAILALWGAWTHALYGSVHFGGGVSLVVARGIPANELWNQTLSLPVFYGAALGFPILLWVTRLARGAGTELAVAGLVAGALVMVLVLPEGRPIRRASLDLEEAALGAIAFASAVVAWGEAGWRALRSRAGADRFLLVWVGGLLVFSTLVNWHVNSADALLAAPPLLMLLYRHGLRPTPRAGATWVAGLLAVALVLTAADVRQRNVYREAAQEIAREIGDAPGRRWLIGQWGFQHYLVREGFEPIRPPQYHGRFGLSELATGDWVATARNVPQLDVAGIMAAHGVAPVRIWTFEARLPLRVNHPDAGAGFYSHVAGYVPFAWSRLPLDQVGLARVTSAPRPSGSRGP